jgi:hypothetical protein
MPAKNARYFKSDLTVMNLADEMADIASKIESICEALVVDKNVEVTLSGSILAEATVLNVTTAGTRVQLPDILCHEVTIIAKRTNTGYIYAGKNTVSSTVYGVEFAAKDSFTFNVSNANQIYIDASISGEGISYVAI